MRGLTDRQQDIIKLLAKKPLKALEIIDVLNINITPRSMQRELLKLKELRRIKSEGKSRNVIWSLNTEA